MKKSIRILLSCSLVSMLLLASLQSCDDGFDEINTDPNSFNDVPLDYFLPGSILSIANLENGYFDGYLYPSLWVQHTTLGSWLQPGTYFYEKERSVLWSNMYRGPLADLDHLISLAEEKQNPTTQAVAMILHSYGFSLLLNSFGDLPYSESFKVDQNINQPEYEEQSAVYDMVLEKLRQADSMLENESSIDIDQKNDILFGGDALKWRKFANSVRFRILMQLSSVRDVSSEIGGITPMLESSQDNAIFSYSGDIDSYPPAQALGSEATDQGHRIAESLVDQMLATNDPRLAVYAVQTGSGDYIGAPIGEFFENSAEYSKVNPANFERNAKVVFMDFAELNYLKAEAAQRGLIAGDPIAFLSMAIDHQMSGYGVASVDRAAYISALTADGTNLIEIYTEKWVGSFGRGLTAWTDYRRVEVPALTPVPAANVSIIPKRYTYPINEQSANGNNLSVAVDRLNNGDKLDSHLYWTKQ